ncbi:MAG: 30S ribosomal protein S6 [Planctomycetota bacterium]|jgi:small subunit ribosomal protein S6|nr:MAG: 30S ribosomal protein S6 [Planctomycetota bacterium]RLS96909.1 MAG: 30S ribosomal protein S6 [Planctomycetota bacterium]
MAETRINAYEGMFLFPQTVSADLQSAADHVLETLSKGGAEVISLCKWDERRLAYDIKGNKRGVYFLTYFKCDAQKLTLIERDCRLSEKLLRSMITRADHVSAEQMLAMEGRQQLADETALRKSQPGGGENELGAVVTVVLAPVAAGTEVASDTAAE